MRIKINRYRVDWSERKGVSPWWHRFVSNSTGGNYIVRIPFTDISIWIFRN